jgi:hypothetical protein
MDAAAAIGLFVTGIYVGFTMPPVCTGPTWWDAVLVVAAAACLASALAARSRARWVGSSMVGFAWFLGIECSRVFWSKCPYDAWDYRDSPLFLGLALVLGVVLVRRTWRVE